MDKYQLQRKTPHFRSVINRINDRLKICWLFIVLKIIKDRLRFHICLINVLFCSTFEFQAQWKIF